MQYLDFAQIPSNFASSLPKFHLNIQWRS